MSAWRRQWPRRAPGHSVRLRLVVLSKPSVRMPRTREAGACGEAKVTARHEAAAPTKKSSGLQVVGSVPRNSGGRRDLDLMFAANVRGHAPPAAGVFAEAERHERFREDASGGPAYFSGLPFACVAGRGRRESDLAILEISTITRCSVPGRSIG